MARRKNNGGSGGGALLVLALFVGIIAEFGAVLLGIGAIVGVFYLIYKLSSTNSTSGSSNQHTGNTSQTGMTDAAPAKQISAPRQTSFVNKNEEKVKEFVRRYRVEMIPDPAANPDLLQKEMESFQCIEVLQAVNRVLSQRRDCIKKMNVLKTEIDRVLACPGCVDTKDQIQFLEKNKPYLQEKRNEYDVLKKQLRAQKITLLDKHSLAFANLKDAINKVHLSSKITSQNGVDFSSFAKMNASLPDDLFYSSVRPVALNFGAYRFFLLPEVILAYNKQNRFVTAFEPMALIITGKEVEKNVYMSKEGYGGNWRHRDILISDDSVKVSEGITRTSWLHERKSGGPDMRYSHNPMYQNRTDVFRHGEISFQIGQYRAVYSFSAGNQSQKMKALVREYTTIAHKLNATPSLLRLLETTAKKTENAHRLCEGYEGSSKNIFCKVG